MRDRISIAPELLDALLGTGRPYVEVHLSNLHAREPFRERSLLAPRAAGIVMGFGAVGYELALRGLAGHLGPRSDRAGADDTAEAPTTEVRREDQT
mgnify:CR=1 FL=1